MKKGIFLLLCFFLMIPGCGVDDKKEAARETNSNSSLVREDREIVSKDEEKEEFLFRDVFGEEYTTVINPDVMPCKYKKEAFKKDGDKMSYVDSDYSYRLGVDVSHHQGYIDWNKVRAQGYDFAILRIGYRGYGKEGSIRADREFERNYQNAKAAGLDVGVYFFAQAINEKEAEEEARFVLSILDGRKLDLPVVYDPESILDDEARTDNVSGEQFTKNTEKFLSIIEESGYDPMIYSNMLWEAFELDLSKLPYPMWYADYEPIPQTPYHFVCWQYYNEGKVEGISGNTDLNILITEK